MSGEGGPEEEPIKVISPDSGWPALFEAEKALIVGSLGAAALEVHHVGSTAVPGLAAKPIIDILVAVESLDDRTALDEGLSTLGYVNIPHDDDGNRLFFRKGVPRRYHVHVVRLNSWTYWKHLLFRDALRSDPGARADYERLKFDLAIKYRDDRAAYAEAKGEFIEGLVAKMARGRYVPAGRQSK